MRIPSQYFRNFFITIKTSSAGLKSTIPILSSLLRLFHGKSTAAWSLPGSPYNPALKGVSSLFPHARLITLIPAQRHRVLGDIQAHKHQPVKIYRRPEPHHKYQRTPPTIRTTTHRYSSSAGSTHLLVQAFNNGNHLYKYSACTITIDMSRFPGCVPLITSAPNLATSNLLVIAVGPFPQKQQLNRPKRKRPHWSFCDPRPTGSCMRGKA